MNVLVLLAAQAVAQEADWTSRVEKSAGVKTLRVEASAGEVQVVSDREGAQIVIEKLGEDPDKRCAFAIRRAQGELLARAERKPGVKGRCAVGLRVIAPEAVDVRAASGSGGVSVRGFSRAVSARAGSGSVSLESLRGSVDAKTGSGAIKAVGLSGDAVAATGSGRVSLAFANPPKKISASTGSGEVEIRLPRASTVSFTLKAASGRTKSDFPNDKAGRTRIEVKSGSGDVALVGD